MPKSKQKRAKRPVNLNLNLILWFSFLLFAIVLLVISMAVQNYQMNRRYRETMTQALREAGAELKETLGMEDLHPNTVSKVMLSAANRYGVSAYLISLNGELVYPNLLEEEAEEYRSILEMVKDTFAQLEEQHAADADFDITKAQAELSSDRALGYATMVKAWGQEHYLYLTVSLGMINRITADTTFYSLITALFSVIFSVVVSGFVSMIITKPVTEVTERAKELARGDYEFKTEKSYFCTEVNELSQALDVARTEISRTDRMQKELIANVSHDFKTPLTMIKAYAAMIREISGDDPEKRDKHTRIIIDEADRLAALVGDVLDLSRLQAGIDNSERTVFNLSEEVYGAVGRFEYLTETQGYSVETDIDEDLYTYAGKERVGQVLYNLIGNAFNYTGEDKKIVVRLKKEETGARFEVIDSGKGIPPEEIDTIWERYYRSSESHKRPVQGTGLGLSIVKNVLQKYNLPFGVTSKVGEGSCFWIRFSDPPESH